VLQDNEGGYWFSTLDRGVFYFPNLSIRNFEVERSKISCVAMDKGDFYIGNYKGDVTTINRFSNQRKRIRNLESPVTAISCDQYGGLLVSTAKKTVVMEK